uniref:Uncharacterized protein n=2 Tax=Brassica oleracea TaxID=3712 RepID=A0A0D3CRT0_BRAOL|nr:unnamed protein product [Brassica oleracea]
MGSIRKLWNEGLNVCRLLMGFTRNFEVPFWSVWIERILKYDGFIREVYIARTRSQCTSLGMMSLVTFSGSDIKLSAGKCLVAFHFNDVSPGLAESELRFWLIQLWDGSLEPGEGGLGSCFERIVKRFIPGFTYSRLLRVLAFSSNMLHPNGTEGETQKAEPEKKGGRGRKRNAATQMKAKKVVAAMLYSIDSLQVWGYKVCKRYYALRELKKLIEVAEKLREKRWP